MMASAALKSRHCNPILYIHTDIEGCFLVAELAAESIKLPLLIEI